MKGKSRAQKSNGSPPLSLRIARERGEDVEKSISVINSPVTNLNESEKEVGRHSGGGKQEACKQRERPWLDRKGIT